MEQHETDRSARGGRRRPLALKILLVVVGMAAGMGLTLSPRLLDEDEGPRRLPLTASEPRSVAAGLSAAGPLPTLSTPGAASPVEAVERFLAAEQRGDLAASFELLSAEDRRSIPSPAAWIDEHSELLAPVLGFEVRSPEPSAAGVMVPAVMSFEPGLNEFSGLTPGRAEARWLAVAGEQGWRVFLGGSTLAPMYPSDTSAPAAAQGWLQERSACDPTAAAGPGVTFLGLRRELVNRVCEAHGPFTVGAATPVDDPLVTSDLVAAFGPTSPQWARLVPVGGPLTVRLLMAPIGEGWAVVDVVGPGR